MVDPTRVAAEHSRALAKARELERRTGALMQPADGGQREQYDRQVAFAQRRAQEQHRQQMRVEWWRRQRLRAQLQAQGRQQEGGEHAQPELGSSRAPAGLGRGAAAQSLTSSGTWAFGSADSAASAASTAGTQPERGWSPSSTSTEGGLRRFDSSDSVRSMSSSIDLMQKHQQALTSSWGSGSSTQAAPSTLSMTEPELQAYLARMSPETLPAHANPPPGTAGHVAASTRADAMRESVDVLLAHATDSVDSLLLG